MLNIGTLDRHIQIVSRNNQINADGSISVPDGNEYSSKGYLYAKQIIKNSGTAKIAEGLADNTGVQWLVRYGEVMNYYINPGDFIKFQSQYYRIESVSEAPEYGRNRAAFINSTIMNRVLLDP